MLLSGIVKMIDLSVEVYEVLHVCCANVHDGVFLVLLEGPVDGDFPVEGDFDLDFPTASLNGE
jgi:hypothetical protein